MASSIPVSIGSSTTRDAATTTSANSIRDWRRICRISVSRKIEEIVLCSATGELLYEWQSKTVDRRILLLDLLSNIVLSFAKNPLLTRGERLEVDSPETRSVMLIQPDRRIFVSSVPKK